MGKLTDRGRGFLCCWASCIVWTVHLSLTCDLSCEKAWILDLLPMCG